MARIEKTIFISYRRRDISWALAVYQYLTSQKYDVFFDFSSLSSGDFEEVIVSNIRARAHFVLILTPTALDRCNEPGDWLRREIEAAVDEKRNIIPLFFDGFNFGLPSIADKLTGKLGAIRRYNGLDIPSGYFIEAMGRLSGRYLNVPLDAVIHPVSTEIRRVVKEEQVAADKALEQKREDIEELIKPAEGTTVQPKQRDAKSTFRTIGIAAGILLTTILGVFGISSLVQNAFGGEIPVPTLNRELVVGFTPTLTKTFPTSIVTVPPFTPTPELDIGSTIISPKDGMTLLYVPAGDFVMGSYDGDVDERPAHTVNLDAFWIDQTEVTNRQYGMCVSAGNCALPLSLKSPLRPSYYGDPRFDDYPVIYIEWNMAISYCEWAGRHLPTEAEWEKAARGKDGRIYPWGNDMPNGDLLNYNTYWTDTSVVRQYPAGKSPYGVYDMAGNVWEWTSSLYMPYPYDATDGREDLTPKRERVLRGGSWYYQEGSSNSIFRYGVIPVDFLVRSDVRSWSLPLYADISIYGRTKHGFGTVGFRCAMDVE